VLPAFRPARPARRQTTLTFEEVSVGDRLPLCPVPITPTLIVAGAIASRDYQDVHHDRNQAQQKGSKDIFMNILTSSGLSSRYLNDWAGPHAAFKSLKLRLGVPNHPYDTMTFRGSVSAKERAGREGVVTVAYQGLNSLGAHVTGSAELVLPSRS
jgi:acyl dehydratase